MERLLIHQLLKWKESTHRKPLVLEGARQVGKTWLLREFGKKHFKDVCYINFEQKDRLESIFAGDLSPQFIIEQLSSIMESQSNHKPHSSYLMKCKKCLVPLHH